MLRKKAAIHTLLQECACKALTHGSVTWYMQLSPWPLDCPHLHTAYMWHELLMLKLGWAYHVAGAH